MRCPFCAHEDSQVKDSRPAEDGSAIRRRRQCSKCGARFTTFERVQLREVTIVKAGAGGAPQRREPFDRAKLERSVALACRKRGIAQEQIDQLVSGIQRQVETAGESEIASAKIGELVMDGLRQIDSVAYIRFASVYRDFSEARDFEEFASTVTEAGEAKTSGTGKGGD
ncbi:transcriptional regulator NrdR [Erythrobacter sp.]|jgi:transcriptional repressor NrdR|uniref:transcriptional regulator NrdR n=1 Tax=Erythrobacter sp. TaxID=1042 RepID=UPI002EA295B4|nr:transcriptional regulator NrdR [Erythrobacter sp.]